MRFSKALCLLLFLGNKSYSQINSRLSESEIHDQIISKYKTSSWDEFFGLSTFYRLNQYRSDTNPQTSADFQIRILEIMAHLKHCQFEASKSLIENINLKIKGIPNFNENTNFDDLKKTLDKLNSMFELQKKHQSFVKTTRPSLESTSVSLNSSETQLRQKLALINPLALRVRIQDLCNNN